jgi:integrase
MRRIVRASASSMIGASPSSGSSSSRSAGLKVESDLDFSSLLYQRTTDIRRLRYSQSVGRERRIHFEPAKTAKASGAEVDIPISAALEAVLARARSLAKIRPGPGGDALVTQTRRSGPDSAFGIRSAIDRGANRAGYAAEKGPRSGLTAKDLRALVASCAKAQGYALQQLMAGKSQEFGTGGGIWNSRVILGGGGDLSI